MTLYEIDQQIASLIDPENGEVLDYEVFAELQMDRDKKIENMALWVKEMTANAKAIKDEVEQLTKRKRSLEANADRLKKYIAQALDGQKFQTPRVSISYRKSTALEVDNPEELGTWLNTSGHVDLVVYQPPTIDKRGVTALIKAGEDVRGASLVERQSLTVR